MAGRAQKEKHSKRSKKKKKSERRRSSDSGPVQLSKVNSLVKVSLVELYPSPLFLVHED